MVQDAVIMFFGVVLLTSVWGATLKGWVIAYAISLFVYSFGVGGEYPMVGSHAIEHDSPGPATNRDDRLHRGRNVVLSFLMQGWGQIINQIVLLILLTIFTRGKTEPPYSGEYG